MAHSHFDIFLKEATYLDSTSDATLEPDRLYGLYTSWCFISQRPLDAEPTFWAAMEDRVKPRHNGLRMKGPAAADYILTSYPELM
jgi:hypothetical protein